MALINCPECNREISDKANSCIHCGCPEPNKLDAAATGSSNEISKLCPYCGKSNTQRLKSLKMKQLVIGYILIIVALACFVNYFNGYFTFIIATTGLLFFSGKLSTSEKDDLYIEKGWHCNICGKAWLTRPNTSDGTESKSVLINSVSRNRIIAGTSLYVGVLIGLISNSYLEIIFDYSGLISYIITIIFVIIITYYSFLNKFSYKYISNLHKMSFIVTFLFGVIGYFIFSRYYYIYPELHNPILSSRSNSEKTLHDLITSIFIGIPGYISLYLSIFYNRKHNQITNDTEGDSQYNKPELLPNSTTYFFTTYEKRFNSLRKKWFWLGILAPSLLISVVLSKYVIQSRAIDINLIFINNLWLYFLIFTTIPMLFSALTTLMMASYKARSNTVLQFHEGFMTVYFPLARNKPQLSIPLHAIDEVGHELVESGRYNITISIKDSKIEAQLQKEIRSFFGYGILFGSPWYKGLVILSDTPPAEELSRLIKFEQEKAKNPNIQ